MSAQASIVPISTCHSVHSGASAAPTAVISTLSAPSAHGANTFYQSGRTSYRTQLHPRGSKSSCYRTRSQGTAYVPYVSPPKTVQSPGHYISHTTEHSEQVNINIAAGAVESTKTVDTSPRPVRRPLDARSSSTGFY